MLVDFDVRGQQGMDFITVTVTVTSSLWTHILATRFKVFFFFFFYVKKNFKKSFNTVLVLVQMVPG